MAVDIINGVEHVFAPNPQWQNLDWEKAHPPIPPTVKWLINKYTGEILPYTHEFAYRSDIVTPYAGELPWEAVPEGSASAQVNQMLAMVGAASVQPMQPMQPMQGAEELEIL